VKILIPVKYTIDVSQLKFDESTKQPLLDACPKAMGDADKCAVEEALRIKEKLGGTTAVVSIISGDEGLRVIRDAYAMGVDEGYAVYHPEAERLDALSIARIIAGVYRAKGPYDLILIGLASGDTHSGVVGPTLAAILDIPVISGADSLEVTDEGLVRAKCMMEDGTYVFEARTPAVVTVTTEINEPRIPTLKAILKSKKKPISKVELKDIGLEGISAGIEVLDAKKYEVPRKRVIIDATDPSKIDECIEKIVGLLREEGVL